MLPFLNEPIVLNSACSELECKLKRKIFYPNDYSFVNPELYKYFKNHMFIPVAKSFDIRMLTVDSSSTNYVKDLCYRYYGADSKPIVVVERRNIVTNDSSRNSSYDWLVHTCMKLAKIKQVIFLPDYRSRTFINLKNVFTLNECAEDLLLRAALFEYAELSILPNGGGSPLAYLNRKTRYLHLGLASGRVFNGNYFRREGYTKDVNPFSEGCPVQIWRWNSLSPEEVVDLAKKIISSP